MGKCWSNDPDNTKDKGLTKELRDEKKRDKGVKKLLFLGSGGSGKSTLFKQLRTIHGTGFGTDDRRAFIDHIHAQIVEQMKIALECVEIVAEEERGGGASDDDEKGGADDFNALHKLSPAAQEAAATLRGVKDPKLTPPVAAACKTLWKEDAIQNIYELRGTMGIDDSSNYFWDKIDEIMAAGFVPNETDILLVRYRTTGVIDQKFTIKRNVFHVFDVGGQKSERKKWIHCFENVTAVIFVASLSCYDETMFEDQEKNSMTDQLELFDNICNEQWFIKTSMILFLNKKDLFAQKLADGRPITECPDFLHYDGVADSFEETSSFIKNVFCSKNNQPEDKNIFAHLTCATDQNNVSKVFNDVQHIIIENSLMSAGLMGDFGGDDDDYLGPPAQPQIDGRANTDSNTLLVAQQ